MPTIVFRLFLAVLIFAPLAFGTQEVWSLAVMETGMLACLVLLLSPSRQGRIDLYQVPGLAPLLFFLAFIALQLLPLPPQVIKILAPSIHGLYAETIGVLDPDAWMTLSINRKATLTQFFRFLSYGACYILTLQLLADKVRLRRAVWVVIGFASALSILAILQDFLSPDKIYWFRAVPHAWPVGPFVYHNHFAGFMEMLVPLTLALFFHYRPPVSYKKSWHRKLYDIFGHYRANLHVLLGFAVLLMMTSIFISISRGGIISMSIASVVLLILLHQRRKEGGIFLVPLLGLLLVLAVGWFGWEAIFARFAAMRDMEGELSNSRFIIWHDSLEIIRRFPWTGTGFGTFGDIYPAVRTYPGQSVVDHAHNDYFELLADGGVIGLGLMGWFLAAVLVPSWRMYRQRREPYCTALFLGAICGMLALLVHGVTDFNFYNGANGLFFFFLAGLAVSAAHTRLRNGLVTRLRVVAIPRPGLWGFATVALLAVTLLFNFGIMAGEYRFAEIDKAYIGPAAPAEELQKMREVARAAVRMDLLEARYRFALANLENLLGQAAAARYAFAKAILYNPANAEYLQGAGLFMAGQGETGKADGLMRAGIKLDPTNSDRHGRYGVWLLAMGRREPGLENLRQAIALAPARTNTYVSLMLLHGLTDREILRALPDNARACLIFADYLRTVGQDDLVEVVYRRILDFSENDPAPSPGVFYTIYQHYLQQGRREEAMAVMQRAGELIPAHAGIRLTMARLYEKMNITYRAIEEYEKALAIDPANRAAGERLRKLRGEG